jgi:hypothetical protein
MSLWGIGTSFPQEFVWMTKAGAALIGLAVGLTGVSVAEVGLALGQNASNLNRLKELGVVKDGKLDFTEEKLKAMSNQDFLLLSSTLSNAFAITYEVVRRYQEDLLNRLNEQMSIVDPNWNGSTVKQSAINALSAGLIAQQAWGGSGSYNTQRFNEGTEKVLHLKRQP